MLSEPLHPAIVHFPIVFMSILPLVALAAFVLIARGGDARRNWLPVVALSVALAGSAWVAVRTGENEEEAVEEVVARQAIHEHEEAAELFFPLTVGMLLLAAVGLAGGNVGRIARPTAVFAALLLVGAGYRVGHSGGELVYRHGAGQAYVGSGSVGGETTSPGEHDDDDERGGADRGEARPD